MEHAEPDEGAGVVRQQAEGDGDGGDGQAAAQNCQAPADAVGAEGHADAGEQDEEDAAVLEQHLQEAGQGQIEAQHADEVEVEVGEKDAEDAEAAKGVQLGDALFFQETGTSGR